MCRRHRAFLLCHGALYSSISSLILRLLSFFRPTSLQLVECSLSDLSGKPLPSRLVRLVGSGLVPLWCCGGVDGCGYIIHTPECVTPPAHPVARQGGRLRSDPSTLWFQTTFIGPISETTGWPTGSILNPVKSVTSAAI